MNGLYMMEVMNMNQTTWAQILHHSLALGPWASHLSCCFCCFIYKSSKNGTYLVGWSWGLNDYKLLRNSMEHSMVCPRKISYLQCTFSCWQLSLAHSLVTPPYSLTVSAPRSLSFSNSNFIVIGDFSIQMIFHPMASQLLVLSSSEKTLHGLNPGSNSFKD